LTCIEVDCWCMCYQMIDSHIASVGRHGYNIVWRLGTYAVKLAVNIYLQVSVILT